ncbi:MAG: glutamine synthetase family protein [Bacteroidota bacterium]
MTHAELLAHLSEESFDYARIGIIDLDGVLRGKMVSKSKLLSILSSGFGFCNVVFAWDLNDRLYEGIPETGYPDEVASIDPSTFRSLSWQQNRPFLLADFSENTEGLGAACPRSLLKKVIAKASEMGYAAKFGAEYEWFNFAESPQSWADKGYISPKPISPGMFGYSLHRQSLFQEYTDALLARTSSFDIPVEGIHTETGDGVYEAAISPSDVLKAADRAALFKATIKETANHFGLIASFMAKWNQELPGCGGHIHQSLWDLENQSNLFRNEDGMTQLAEHYLAGQLYCLPYLMPMYAPLVNSYKRYVSGSWAAISVSWGKENRTTALRWINGTSAKSARLETRVPGADANPYLVVAASLASGLYGIEHKLPLNINPTKGNEYEGEKNLPLPDNLLSATKAMEESDIATQLFGEAFTRHFVMSRKEEWAQYNQAVTDWELKRYFEIV